MPLARAMFIFCLLTVTTITSAIGQTASPTSDEIENAIAAIKTYLYDQQDADTGSWDRDTHRVPHHAGGITALATTALLLTGESSQHPKIKLAINHLVTVHGIGTYAVAQRAHVWGLLPEAYSPRMARDAFWLLDAHDGKARFRYTARPYDFDHSATQFGVLGLWEASKRGFEVPPIFWRMVMSHFIDVQNFDGGWGYREIHPSKGSMTAAGVTVLLITQEQLYRDAMVPPRALSRAIEKGERWLDENFRADLNPTADGHDAGRNMYYLYSIERVAKASGIRLLNGQDWYAAGAAHILSKIDFDPRSNNFGSVDQSVVQSAFALMFLAHGRVPIGITKLTVPDHNTHQRPNDIKHLTTWLSDVRERRLTWQRVGLDQLRDRQIVSPMAFLTCDHELTLNDVQRANLKSYLDRGGTLVASPQNGSQAFTQSIKALAKQLYPRFHMQPLNEDHAIFHTVFPVRNPGRHNLLVVSNGVRPLIILTDRDWSFDLQSQTDDQRSQAWQLMANLLMHVTDRGRVRSRLETNQFTKQADDDAKPSALSEQTMLVARARYDGDWLVESAVWEVLGEQLKTRTGLQITTVDIDLEDLGRAEPMPALVHLTGIEALTLTPQQRASIQTYIAQGGTILIETIAGQGAFTASLETQFDDMLQMGTVQFSANHPLITGEGLPGSHDITRIQFRRYASYRWSLRNRPRPRLGVYRIQGRPAVLISREDLSMGVLNIRHWNILGYHPKSARNVMTNIILHTHNKK